MIVCYNSEKFISDTIKSCLNQAYSDFEIIISDDCSTDSTWEIIESFTDKRIKCYKQQINLGEYDNRNFCISKSSGEYIIFIDGEDLLYPHALMALSIYIDKYPSVSQIIARHWDEKIIYPRKINPYEFACLEYLSFGIIALNFTMVLFNRKLIQKLGCFDRKDIKFGDVYMQYKLGLQYDSLIIADGFSWWRRRSGQASEVLLKNMFNFFNETNKIKPYFIKNINIFNEEEKKQALINYYGNILRYSFFQLLKFKFKSVFNYFRDNPIPFKYIKSIWKKPFFYYLKPYSGENPF